MSKEKILIVDDDVQTLPSFEKTLTREGYDVTVADGGFKALELIKKNNYNLVLSDIVMDDCDGMQILAETQRISPDTLVILITGYSSIDSVIQALRKNAIDYIVKPCQKEELKIRIKRALERQKLEEEAKKAELYEKMSRSLEIVAREINNPLTSISSYAELLSRNFLKEETEGVYVEAVNCGRQIKAEIEKISDTIQKMKEITGRLPRQYELGSKIIKDQKKSGFERSDEKTILIVDNDESLLYSVSEFLTMSGYNVDIARRGQDAVRLAKKRNYAVLILNAKTSGIDGYSILKKINTYYTDKKTMIPASIMLTSQNMEDVLQKSKEIGAYAAIHKPFQIQELMGTIQKSEKFVKG